MNRTGLMIVTNSSVWESGCLCCYCVFTQPCVTGVQCTVDVRTICGGLFANPLMEKLWRSSVILTDCNSHACPLGGRCDGWISCRFQPCLDVKIAKEFCRCKMFCSRLAFKVFFLFFFFRKGNSGHCSVTDREWRTNRWQAEVAGEAANKELGHSSSSLMTQCFSVDAAVTVSKKKKKERKTGK